MEMTVITNDGDVFVEKYLLQNSIDRIINFIIYQLINRKSTRIKQLSFCIQFDVFIWCGCRYNFDYCRIEFARLS